MPPAPEPEPGRDPRPGPNARPILATARPHPRTIALDGPAAAGKTTVGRRLAERLGMRCFDTGLLYRALTAAALDDGLDPDDGPALMALIARRPVRVVPSPGSAVDVMIQVGGMDLSSRLRDPAIDAQVSALARHQALREALLEPQRSLARQSPIIMLGRDIGTVVLPDADLKLYLDASAASRASRRLRERLARGEAADYDDVLAETMARDAKDSGRSAAPLAMASNAVRVDTDGCDLEGVVDHLLALALRWPDPLTRGGGRAPCGQALPE